MDIAKITGSKVAVITDNDSNYQEKCINKYKDYNSGNIKIFFEEDNEKPTFEYYLYEKNKQVCESEFGKEALQYMLKNKTTSALRLAEIGALEAPEYIERAINWINE